MAAAEPIDAQPDDRTPVDSRAVLALLANPDTRAVFADVARQGVPSGAARERALARLLAAGLVERDAGGEPVVAVARLQAALRLTAAPPVSGVERFLTREGRLLDYPSRWSDRVELLGVLLSRCVEPDETLSEPELGERLGRYVDDVATMRRYLVDAGLLHRSPDGRSYRRARTGDAEVPATLD